MESYVPASQGGDPETFFGRHRWELTDVEGGTRLVNVESFTGTMARISRVDDDAFTGAHNDFHRTALCARFFLHELGFSK